MLTARDSDIALGSGDAGQRLSDKAEESAVRWAEEVSLSASALGVWLDEQAD